MSENPHASRILVVDTNAPDGQVEPILKALASDKRLTILRHLGGSSCSVNELADALEMPASTVTMHLNLLEAGGLVHTELKPAARGLQKICSRSYDQVIILLPEADRPTEESVDIMMPIGMYVDCQVTPTCGLASERGIIGQFDDPDTFYDPNRINAQLLWFKQGYVEYRFPNRLPANTILESLQVSLEISSEAPLHNDNWPSDITMWINTIEIGTWTSPGDFGGERGALTPEWWEEWNSQYGLLKIWRVTPQGTYIDGVPISPVTIHDLDIGYKGFVSMRIGIKDSAAHLGGLNIFGRCFGNYPQDIVLRLRYRQKTTE